MEPNPRSPGLIQRYREELQVRHYARRTVNPTLLSSLIEMRLGELSVCEEPSAVRSTTMSERARSVFVRIPTLEEYQEITHPVNVDPDAMPLAEEQMDHMGPLKALQRFLRLVNMKQLVSIRYSPEVLEYFSSSGAGWHSRMDAVLREYV